MSIQRQDFQPLKTPLKRDIILSGNKAFGIPIVLMIPERSRDTAWMASVPLDLAHHPTHVVLELGCTRSTRSRKAIRWFQKYALYYGITTQFCFFNKSFVFANSETETCRGSCIMNDMLFTGQRTRWMKDPQSGIGAGQEKAIEEL